MPRKKLEFKVKEHFTNKLEKYFSNNPFSIEFNLIYNFKELDFIKYKLKYYIVNVIYCRQIFVFNI